MKDATFSSARLLELYDRISDVEDAIPRLRRFVLDLAVRGKLVEQDASDEPAAELLKRIAQEEARLVETGKIKNRPSLPKVSDMDAPFSIPDTWHWTRFGSIVDFSAGRTPARNESAFWNTGDHCWVSIADMSDGQTLTETKETVSEESRQQVFKSEPEEPGTMIMSFKLTIGKIARLGVPAFHNEAIISIRPHLPALDPLLFKVLPDLARGGDTKGAIKGATLNRESLSNILIPLPPLAEQQRIVAKVDELMALCDRLEQARAGREAVRDRLTTASLARLTAPESDAQALPAEVGTGSAPDNAANTSIFQSHARFVLQSLPTLTTRPDQIKTLRQTILNLAVRGKLVEQDPTDEPAANLLERAIAAKQSIRAERRIGRSEYPEFSESACEPSLPGHWVSAYLADFGLVLGGKRLPAGASFSAEPTDHIYIRVTDMKNGTILSDGLKYIAPEVQKHIEKYTIDRDDIYITIAGTIGDVGNVPENLHGHNLTENAAKIVFREIDREFLILVLRSQDVQDQFTEKTKQMAQPKLALKRILGARLPLPPLAEQYRIVAKVDALMALCDQLEASLTTTVSTRCKLLNALLHEALEPAADEKVAAE